jgi:probable O-glycosylation ligase (exosortase A-associated)
MKGLIFTYVLTYAGALIAVFNPFYGLLVYICFAIIRPESLWHWSVPEGNYSRIVAIALLGGWVLQGFGNWRLGRAWAIVLGLLGFFGWATVSAFQAVADPELAFTEVEELAKIVLPFLVGITTIQSLSQLRALAWVIVLSQGYLAFEFNLTYYQTYFDPNDWHFGGLDRNGIAITMVTSAGMAFFLGLHEPRWWGKLLALALAALMVHVVLFSLSRGGMLSLLVTAFFTFLLAPKRPLYILVFVVACLVAWRLAGPAVLERFMTATKEEESLDASAQGRLQLWKALAEVSMSRPLFGLGPQNWKSVAYLHGFPPGKDGHSTWLMVAAEMGLPALAFLLLFFGYCMLALFRIARDRTPVPDPWSHYLARMVLASFAGFAVSAQFVTCYGVELPYYITLIGAGVLSLNSVSQAHSVPRMEEAVQTKNKSEFAN